MPAPRIGACRFAGLLIWPYRRRCHLVALFGPTRAVAGRRRTPIEERWRAALRQARQITEAETQLPKAAGGLLGESPSVCRAKCDFTRRPDDRHELRKTGRSAGEQSWI